MALLGIPSGSVDRPARRAHDDAPLGRVRAPLIALVPLLHWTGHLSFAALLVIVFLLGIFMAPYITSQRLDHPRALRRRRATRLEGIGALRRRDAAADRDRARDRRRADRVARRTRRARRRRAHVPLRVRVHRAASSRAGAASRRTTTRRGLLAGIRYLAARPPARADDADRDHPRRRRRRDRRRGAARRVHALRRQRARRRLALHELRRRRGDRLASPPSKLLDRFPPLHLASAAMACCDAAALGDRRATSRGPSPVPRSSSAASSCRW